ncbi:MAG: glycosyltransferase [Bacteroidetes bacterium]|nr:glycosyltransferase [Bacteroidota bacterium]
MNEEKPLVSILILTYNQEEYVARTIESVLDQRGDFTRDIVIGDDFSTDNTRKIINEFKTRFPSLITLNFSQKNNGVIENYRASLEKCRGEYVAVCAGDDYWHDPEKLLKQITFLESNPDFGVVHSDANYLFEPIGRSKLAFRKATGEKIETGSVFEPLLIDNFILAVTTCIRTALIRQHVDFNEYSRLGFPMEDYPMWLELSKHTKIGYLDESLATYRIHSKSIRNTSNFQKRYQFFLSTQAVKNYFIERYGCNEIVRMKVLEGFYKKSLRYSTIQKDAQLVRAAYYWLKSQAGSNLTFIEHLYFLGTRIKFLGSISAFLLKKMNSLD